MNDYYVNAPALPSYGPAALPPPVTSTRVRVGQVLTVLASVFGPPAAAVAAIAAAIVWSDCFIECGGAPDHVSGALLGALAAALLLAGPVFAATLVRRLAWIVAACAVPVAEVLVLVGLAH